MLQILSYNKQSELVWPEGNVTVSGADNGLLFPLYLNKTAPQQMFDPTLFRAVDITFAGALLSHFYSCRAICCICIFAELLAEHPMPICCLLTLAPCMIETLLTGCTTAHG